MPAYYKVPSPFLHKTNFLSPCRRQKTQSNRVKYVVQSKQWEIIIEIEVRQMVVIAVLVAVLEVVVVLAVEEEKIGRCIQLSVAIVVKTVRFLLGPQEKNPSTVVSASKKWEIEASGSHSTDQDLEIDAVKVVNQALSSKPSMPNWIRY